jgi:hypothetical protein
MKFSLPKGGLPLIIASIVTLNTHAGMITNGDFASCDYSGWQKDTDGAGDISFGNDFEIDASGSNCRAAINVDYFDPAGDPFGTPISEAWFANTLYQELDLSGNADSTWELTIGFEVGSEGTNQDPFFVADYFLFGLNDGLGNYFDENGDIGFLVDPTDIDGSFRDSLTFELDSSFTNMTGWFLDAQLNVGVDQFGMPDGFGSTLYINEVTLTEVLAPVTDVPEPSTLAIFGLGLLGLVNRKKLSRRKSNYIK